MRLQQCWNSISWELVLIVYYLSKVTWRTWDFPPVTESQVIDSWPRIPSLTVEPRIPFRRRDGYYSEFLLPKGRDAYSAGSHPCLLGRHPWCWRVCSCQPRLCFIQLHLPWLPPFSIHDCTVFFSHALSMTYAVLWFTQFVFPWMPFCLTFLPSKIARVLQKSSENLSSFTQLESLLPLCFPRPLFSLHCLFCSFLYLLSTFSHPSPDCPGRCSCSINIW